MSPSWDLREGFLPLAEGFLAGSTAALETRRKEPTQASLQRKLSEYERWVEKLVYQLDLFKKFFPGAS